MSNPSWEDGKKIVSHIIFRQQMIGHVIEIHMILFRLDLRERITELYEIKYAM